MAADFANTMVKAARFRNSNMVLASLDDVVTAGLSRTGDPDADKDRRTARYLQDVQ
jgi:hypothetical protein